MKCASRKLRSPLKWHGGKSYLARKIIGLFPGHRVYVEPFIGGGSVLLNKPPSEIEVAGDLNGRLIEFWQTLSYIPDQVMLDADLTPYTQESFDEAKEDLASLVVLTRVVAFLVRNRFSRGGLGKDFAWSDRLRGGQPGDANAWETIRSELPAIAERIQGVAFYHAPAIQVIGRWINHPDAVIYCDPPYLHETRTHKNAYDHEMSVDQHRALLDVLLDCQGKVFLSGYMNTLYDDMLRGWTRHEFDLPNHSGQGKTKQRRIECVWEKP